MNIVRGDMKGGNAVHCDTGLLSYKLVIGGYDSVATKGQNTKLSVSYWKVGVTLVALATSYNQQ